MKHAQTEQNALYALFGREEVSVELRQEDTILTALRRAQGLAPHAPCGGMGTCGKCTVTLLEPEGEREVLACRTPALPGMRLRIPEGGEERILTGTGQGSVRADGEVGYGLAVDIGTTTVVCQLIDLTDGTVMGTAGEPNAQRPFGADVISRISAWSQGQGDELTQAIRGQLGRMAEELRGESPLRRVAVAANPTMCHLLTGLSPEGLGRAPYAPASLFGKELSGEVLGLEPDTCAYILPSVSGFIGGDITAGMLCAGLDRGEETTLLLDVGTNGELVLSRGGGLLCCSCAAGPAFEGAQIRFGMTAAPGAVCAVSLREGEVVCETVGGGEAVGICGSGLIDAVAVMLQLGALEPSGRLLDGEEDDDIPPAALPRLTQFEGESAFRLTDTVFVTQRDIRRVQLGKAAVAAGVRVLLDAAGIAAEQVDRVLLAGGFGSCLRPESAAAIGLIPAELLGAAEQAGNTAVLGARMALVSGADRARLEQLAGRAQYIELSGLPAFNAAYVEEMAFPGEEE